jgi:hypothetical protein
MLALIEPGPAREFRVTILAAAQMRRNLGHARMKALFPPESVRHYLY